VLGALVLVGLPMEPPSLKGYRVRGNNHHVSTRLDEIPAYRAQLSTTGGITLASSCDHWQKADPNLRR